LLSNNRHNLARELSELVAGVWDLTSTWRIPGTALARSAAASGRNVRKQQEILIEKVREEIVTHAKEGTFI
jgi:hypothetical protein